MTDESPLQQTVEVTIDAAASGADNGGGFVEAPFAGTVSAVAVEADAAITGANTDSRTVQLVKADQTVVASKAFVSGVNAAADADTALTLSVVAGATTVAAGDVLEFESVHVGSTGLAAPKLQGRVTFTRS